MKMKMKFQTTGIPYGKKIKYLFQYLLVVKPKFNRKKKRSYWVEWKE